MNDIKLIGNGGLKPQQMVNAELFERWIEFIDVKPGSIETYRKSIRQFFLYMKNNGITAPQRSDIIAYRDFLKQRHKPTTVQNYLISVKLFFQWTAQEKIYPNVAERVKGAKIDAGHKKDYLTTKQVIRVLNGVNKATLKGKRDYANKHCR